MGPELFGLLRNELSTDQRTTNILASNILSSLEDCYAIKLLPSISGAAVLGDDISKLLRTAWNNELEKGREKQTQVHEAKNTAENEKHVEPKGKPEMKSATRHGSSCKRQHQFSGARR